MQVINWLDLKPTDTDLNEVLAHLQGKNDLRLVLWQLVRSILSGYPWEGRDDMVTVFNSSECYQTGDWVALPKRDEQEIRPDSWRIASVKKMHDTDNSVQGPFRVIWVDVEGKEKAFACNMPTGDPLPMALPADDEGDWDMLADDLVDIYRPQLEDTILKAIDDGRLDLVVLAHDTLCGKEWLRFSEEQEAAIEEALEIAREGRPYTTTAEILGFLREGGWLVDLRDEVACFCIDDYLEQRKDDYQFLGFSRWIPVDQFAKIDRQVGKRPRVPTIASKVAQEHGEDDSPEFGDYDEVELDEEGQRALEEMGEEGGVVEAGLGVEDWRRSAPTKPVKVPTITYQNVIEGFLPLSAAVSKCFPPASDKVPIDIHAIDRDRLPFIVDWQEGVVKALDKDAFRLKFVEHGLPAGTHLWVERISDTKYGLSPKPLPQPRQVRCKFAWIEDGKLKVTTGEIQLQYESDPNVFKSELRFQDVDALFQEAEQLGWSIFDAMYYTFPELPDIDDPNHRVHHTELFNAVFFRYRMCSPRSVQAELYRRPCFISLGDGYWRFDPSLGIKPRSVKKTKPATKRPSAVQPTVRRPKERSYGPRERKLVGPKPPRPEEGVWGEIAKLVGQRLETLDEGNRFKVVKVGENHVELLLSRTGNPRRIERGEIEAAWDQLIREGSISRSTIHRKYSEFNPPYVSAILAALPGVTHKTKPIRLFYQREPEKRIAAEAPDIGIRHIVYPIPFADRPLSDEIREALLQQLGAVQRGFDFISWQPGTPEELDEYLIQCIVDKEANRFVTPREVVDFMVNIAQPRPGERVIDISCGTGIFLVKALRFVKRVYGEDADLQLYGADIYDGAVDAARLNLKANGARNSTVVQTDSLLDESDMFTQSYDLILGNPPFGSGQARAFLKRWSELLQEDGRMAVNVSMGTLAKSSRSHQEFRRWLINSVEISIVVSLPLHPEPGLHGTKSNACLIWKKRPTHDHMTVLSIVADPNQYAEVLQVLSGGPP